MRLSVIGGLILTLCLGACTDGELEEPIKPSDAGSIDPNSSTAAGDPALGIEQPASPLPEDEDDDAPLGTLTDEPWGPPAGLGESSGEDLASPSTAPDSAEGPTTSPDDPDLDGAFEDKPVYAPGKRRSTAPRVTETLRDGSKRQAKTKIEGTGKNKRWVTAVILNVRSAPNRTSKVVRTMNGGTTVMVDIVDDKWAKLKDGEYIRLRHLSVKPQRTVSSDEVTKRRAAEDKGPKIKVNKPLGKPMKKSDKK
jgi:hypothetical protein